MITWKHIDGSTTVFPALQPIDDMPKDSLRQILRCLTEARRMLQGRFPSINSRESIDDMIDYMDTIWKKHV